MRVILVTLRLVKHTEYLIKTIIDNSMEQRDLNYNTVMHKTLHKGIRHALCHFTALIVVSFMTDIEHRYVDIANPVTHDIDRHHRISETFVIALLLVNIVLVTVLSSEILAKTKRLRLHPRFLQFNENKFRLILSRTDPGAKVDTEHRDLVVGLVGILVWTQFNTDNILLQ